MRILSGIMSKFILYISDCCGIKDWNQVLILINYYFNILRIYSKYLKLLPNQMDTSILCIVLNYQAPRGLHIFTKIININLPFSCTECDKGKKYISNLYYIFFNIKFRYFLFIIFIVNIFYNILPFLCSECLYEQKWCLLKIKDPLLGVHLRTHTGETTIKCVYWDKYFALIKLPILCPECDYDIIMRGAECCSIVLEIPNKIHTGEELSQYPGKKSK